jgi:hypothetical protein
MNRSSIKALVSVLFFGAGLVSSSPAFAGDVYQSQLERISLDSHYDTDRPVDKGEVVLDFASRQVRLSLGSSSLCPRGRLCIMPVRPLIALELPMTGVKKDACGVVTVTAARGDQTIEVVDHASSTCIRLANQAPTVITFREQGVSESVFEGGKLEAVDPR